MCVRIICKGYGGLDWVWGGEERMGCQAVVEYIIERQKTSKLE